MINKTRIALIKQGLIAIYADIRDNAALKDKLIDLIESITPDAYIACCGKDLFYYYDSTKNIWYGTQSSWHIDKPYITLK